MASRKEQQDRLSAERQAKEAAGKRRARRRRRMSVGVLMLAVLVATVAVALTTRNGGPTATGASGVDGRGYLSGPPPWPPEYDHLADRLSKVTFPPLGDESFHVHALLSVFVNGKPITVPANVGFGPAVGEVPLHTHTPDGVLHIEANEPYPFTLGQFFDVWGVKFTDTQLGPYKNRGGQERVQAFVDGNPLRDPVNHVIAEGENLVVGYGKPGSFHALPDASALEGS